MEERVIPTPRSLHNRATFGHAEKSIANLPVLRVIQEYLYSSKGDGFMTVNFFGTETRELAVVALNDIDLYVQSLQVAQYLWDMGYYVSYGSPRIPGHVGPAVSGLPAMYICWNTDVVANRGMACPCWTCPITPAEKLECLGCDKYKVYLAHPRRSKGGT